MKIKSRLRLNSVITLGAVLLMFLAHVWTMRQVSMADQDVNLADSMRDLAIQRALLRDEYLLYREARSKAQWLAKTESLRSMLALAASRFDKGEDKALLQDAQEDFDATVAGFSMVMEGRERRNLNRLSPSGFGEVEARLTRQVFLKAYSLTDNINRLHELANERARFTRDRMSQMFVVLFLGGLIATIANSALIARTLAYRLAALSKGVLRIGDGDLDYRIEVAGDDELSSLALANNEMAAKLKQSYAVVKKEIAERTQAEEEREQFYKFFLTSADIMAIADPNGAFLKVNPACIEQLGYLEEELVAKPFIDFVHPDDKQSTLDEMARQQIIGTSLAFVNRYICKDGSFRWLSWRAVYNKDENCTYAIARDITENKRQEEALRNSEHEFRLLAEAMPQIVWITRSDGWNIYFNQQWMDYTGMTLEESLGHGWNKPFHPDDQQVAWDAWQNATTKLATYSLECRLRRADGVYKWWLVRGVPVFDDQGAVLKWFGTCTDIDEFKKAEEERLSLEKQLLHAQKLESLGILAGGIAHDFNNILMAIIGNAELARMKLVPESPIVSNLQQIDQAAMRAADLAKQMLAYSGKGKFLIVKLDLNRLIEEMLSMLEVSISKKALLKLNLAPDLPAVEADASQIQQIIMNLVINASEAIGDEGGFITITTGSMECTAGYLKQLALNENIAEGLYVYLEITDTGCGMDKETLGRIFDPFFTTKFTGRGLGMAAVHGIVRGHKGGLNIYSEPGKGTTFKVLLPASGSVDENVNKVSPDADWQGSGTVLLVDDEEMIREVGAELLRSLGFTVITANDGVDALQVFKSGGDIVCVVLDLTMPKMGGEQCFHVLRQLCPEVKVIMSSGYSEQEVAEKFTGMEVAGFIQKPFSLSALRVVLKGAFS